MTGADWNSGYAKALAVCLNGDAITEPGPRGERITDADFVFLINAHSGPVTFTIPPHLGSPGEGWQVVVDTGPAPAIAIAPGLPPPGGTAVSADGSALRVEVASRAIVVLRGTGR
jgi:glycogen operon protein